jgi:hypothetical protein
MHLHRGFVRGSRPVIRCCSRPRVIRQMSLRRPPVRTRLMVRLWWRRVHGRRRLGMARVFSAVDETGLGCKRPFVIHHGRFVNIDCQSACVNVCFGLDAPCTSIDSWSESDGGCTATSSCSDAEVNFGSCDTICDACIGPNGSPPSSTRFTTRLTRPRLYPSHGARFTYLSHYYRSRERDVDDGKNKKDLSNYFVPTHLAECVTKFRPCSLVAQSS